MHPWLSGWHWRQQTGGGWLYGGLRGPPHGVRRSRMRIDPRTLAQRNKACAREQQTMRVEDAVRPRAVCLLRFRTGTGWLVRISEAVGSSEMPCWRQVAAAAGGITPSEMRLRGSRSWGGLKRARWHLKAAPIGIGAAGIQAPGGPLN